MQAKVKARPEVSQDLDELSEGLDESAARALIAEALRYMVDLRERPFFGEALDDLADTGDLSDCRKIYFGNYGYRIIYRVLPHEGDPQLVDVIAVGPRAQFEVYHRALERGLGGSSTCSEGILPTLCY